MAENGQCSSADFAVTDEELLHLARDVRRDIVTMVRDAGSGHIGGSLSAVEILLTLYFRRMRVDPANPLWPDRDRFILSKGHATPVYYSVLARRGYFPVSELSSFRRLGSRLQGHPDMKKTPGIDFSSGSLGQGLSVGSGIAWGLKRRGSFAKVYVLLGDGELDEGQVWEAAMAAGKFALDNLTAIVDRNGLQLDGTTDSVMPLGNIADKFRAFSWSVTEADGHDMAALCDALVAPTPTGVPRALVVRTVKGKGVPFMENNHVWHGRVPDEEEYKKAMAELGG